ncbi:DUF3888 domain-containing protein [Clostridium sp. C8-1-8]|uniref:DUF3888 domain-containing protein n=1 Tax=Clostridium sp. C8-1-8 TaxID=2698831 RepID=UPI00136CBCC1|nr:DUF3888 domain-containing protein [Clostridium sp. C8-1-8]
MKKFLLIIFFMPTLLCVPSYFTASASEQINLVEKYNYNLQEESKEILYNDIIMAMLTPYIQREVEKYYGTYYSVEPWANDIVSIERPNGDRTSYFIIEIEIMPYTGPHNSVGIDRITISIDSSEIKVLKFKHLHSF